MKPRIFIAMHYMEIGGAETALVGLLNALDPKRVNVDLFLYDHRGEMMEFIPDRVNLLPPIPKYCMLERPVVELIRHGFFSIAIARLWARYKSKKAYRKSGSVLPDSCGFDKISKYTTPLLPTINPHTIYDLAISFLTPHRIVLKNVCAKKKIAWIHTDYTRIWVDAAEELKVWSQYDYIGSISSDVTTTFLKVFPSLANKIVEIENILSPNAIRQRADLQDVSDVLKGRIKLLSIGRFSEAKNYDNIPDICKQSLDILKNKDGELQSSTLYDIKWFLIGYGSDESLIRQKIKEAGMEDHVIILGKKQNPYPYIKACDIYVQPSRYEGKSVTVREAQILCKPVVVTNYPTASSQIKNGIDGVIVPMDNEGCAKKLAEVICDKPLRERLAEYLKTHDYGNESEVEKIYRLIP